MAQGQFNFQALKASWPSAIVARSKVREFSGGAVSPGTLANADSAGSGPKGRFQIGRITCYPIDSLIEWLQRKAARSNQQPNPSGKQRRAS